MFFGGRRAEGRDGGTRGKRGREIDPANEPHTCTHRYTYTDTHISARSSLRPSLLTSKVQVPPGIISNKRISNEQLRAAAPNITIHLVLRSGARIASSVVVERI